MNHKWHIVEVTALPVSENVPFEHLKPVKWKCACGTVRKFNGIMKRMDYYGVTGRPIGRRVPECTRTVEVAAAPATRDFSW